MQPEEIFTFKAALLRIYGTGPTEQKMMSMAAACVHRMQESGIDNFMIAHALHAAAFHLLLYHEDAEDCWNFAKFSNEYSSSVIGEAAEKLSART
jgi:hypothetical protein